jgi:hypothetical protein
MAILSQQGNHAQGHHDAIFANGRNVLSELAEGQVRRQAPPYFTSSPKTLVSNAWFFFLS